MFYNFYGDSLAVEWEKCGNFASVCMGLCLSIMYWKYSMAMLNITM
jgi:hypothetical protein